jgi:hypothetical protein
MHELLRTNDAVLVSFVEALLREQRIDYHVADLNTSAVEASIGIFPRRILIASSDAEDARTLLIDAGLGKELPLMDGPPEDHLTGRPSGSTA